MRSRRGSSAGFSASRAELWLTSGASGEDRQERAMTTTMLRSAFLLSAVHALATAGAAQAIPDRQTLNSLLPPWATLEQFESLPTLGANASTDLDVAVLGAETVVGPVAGFPTLLTGLVAYGAEYRVPGGTLWANAPQFGSLGFSTRSLGVGLFNLGRLDIAYSPPVPIMGLDVSTGGSGQAVFRAADGSVLGTTNWTTAGPTFVGFQSSVGVASVELTSSVPFTPAIDDHAYALDQSLFARRRRIGSGCGEQLGAFYELHQAFDLSNTSLELLPTATGYSVTAGTNPVTPPTAAPIVIPNLNIVPFQLGWSFPYAGSTTSSLYVGSDGYVALAPLSFRVNNLGAFLDDPMIAARLIDLRPRTSGTVTFETDAQAQTATITFDQVEEYLNPANTHTFQFHFDGSGRIELRFGACAPGGGVTGWNPAVDSENPGSIDLSTAVPFTVPLQDRGPVTLAADQRPLLGTTVNLVLTELSIGTSLAAYFFGLTQVSTTGLPVPVAALPSCLQFTGADAVLLLVPSGTAGSLPLSLPAAPALAGTDLFVQCAVEAPIGMPGARGILLSNALHLLVNTL
ncbi:MAG: hypothetical protein KDE27_24770 [Planctomycetes bacterium]|nr:hypothetical protein [Planctomycetota bacterium]